MNNSQRKLYNRRYYEKRKAAGLCPKCGVNRPEAGFVTCPQCQEDTMNRHRQNMARSQAARADLERELMKTAARAQAAKKRATFLERELERMKRQDLPAGNNREMTISREGMNK